MKKIIELKNITKFYGEDKVLNDINLKIYNNSLIGLVGLNGSGKTTLLSVIFKLITNIQGEILQEKDLKISGLIDQPAFYPHLSAFENLNLICLIKGIDNELIPDTLNRVNLQKESNKKYKTFSLGMRKRLGIAASLMGNPDIILLDEPISGLDPHGIREIREIVYKLFKTGKTIIISSHILSEIEMLCTHILHLDEGEVKYYGKKDLLLNKTDNLIEIYCNNTHSLAIILEKIDEITRIEASGLSVLVYFKNGISIEDANRVLEKNGVDTSELSLKKNNIENAIFNYK
jgi:ABC-2 type transport system ATP-binding protein